MIQFSVLSNTQVSNLAAEGGQIRIVLFRRLFSFIHVSLNADDSPLLVSHNCSQDGSLREHSMVC